MLAESWKAYSGRFAKSSTFRSKLFCNPAMTICNVSVFNACFNATRLCDNIQLKYPHSEVSCSAILPHLGVHSHSCFNAFTLQNGVFARPYVVQINKALFLLAILCAFQFLNQRNDDLCPVASDQRHALGAPPLRPWPLLRRNACSRKLGL